MKRPRLTPDDLALWRAVTERTERLKTTVDTSEIKAIKQGMAVGNIKADPKKALTPSRPLRTGVQARPSLRMDKKTFDRMSRGKLIPEARIDLHGMTLARAHPALSAFIHNAHGSGKRLVLVITGKGKFDVNGDYLLRQRGVLRQQVPHWLSLPPLSLCVLEYRSAHVKHGGSGALYVYLKRQP